MLFLSFLVAKAKKESIMSSMTFTVQSKDTYLLEERYLSVSLLISEEDMAVSHSTFYCQRKSET